MKTNRFRKYFAFSKAGILGGFAYKFSAIGWLLGDAISLLILYFLWQAVYKNAPSETINGLKFNDMIAYLIYARIATTLIFSSSSFWQIGEDIYEGNIAFNLIRPIHYRYRLLATSFGNFISALILMFIPLMIIAMATLYFGVGISVPRFDMMVLFMFSAVLSFVIADALNFLIGEISLFTNALFGLMIIKNITMSFFSGSLLPSSFFPSWLNQVLDFLPFKSMIETPVMMLLSKMDYQMILTSLLTQFMWVIILSLLCNLSFNVLKKHVVSVGG